MLQMMLMGRKEKLGLRDPKEEMAHKVTKKYRAPKVTQEGMVVMVLMDSREMRGVQGHRGLQELATSVSVYIKKNLVQGLHLVVLHLQLLR